MVWAVVMPSGFGKYFPKSDFFGWADHMGSRLKTLPPEVKETLDGSVAGYCYRVSLAFTMEVRNADRPKSPVRKPDIDELPQEIRLERSYPDLASLLMLRSQMLAVDENLRDIIETLEPGLHRFWPLRVTTPKGAAFPKRYFGLIIGRFLDSFDPEATPPESLSGPIEYQNQAIYPAKAVWATLALRAEQSADAHLWRERRLINPNVFLSDTLQAELAKAGLTILKHHKVKVV